MTPYPSRSPLPGETGESPYREAPPPSPCCAVCAEREVVAAALETRIAYLENAVRDITTNARASAMTHAEERAVFRMIGHGAVAFLTGLGAIAMLFWPYGERSIVVICVGMGASMFNAWLMREAWLQVRR